MIPRNHFRSIVYRAHHPMWAYSPLSGEGAKQHGGRFNPPGTAALYTSLDFTTAWLEAQQGFPFKPQPLTLVAYRVDCTNIVDLTQPYVQKLLGINPETLSCAWEWLVYKQQIPPTWALAEKLQAEGVVGIVVNSYAPSCIATNQNLVLWQWSAIPPHAIVVIDDLSRLPQNQTSWEI